MLVMDIGDQRAIGRLEGKLDHIIADQDRARTERKNQYERQEVTDRHIEIIGQKLDALDARLKKVEESASEISKWRERGVGAMMLISIVAASIGGAFATFGRKLWAFIAG